MCLLCSGAGVFTAPVPGLYYFTFTACGPHPTAVELQRNGDGVHWNAVVLGVSQPHVSNLLTLELLGGDEVQLHLPAGSEVSTCSHKHTSFTGFMLFPM